MRLVRMLVLCAGLGAASCAASGPGDGEPDLSMPPPDGGAGDGGEEMACFQGEPQTEPQLLNRCTDAERVMRPHRVPVTLWDGKGPLPPPPL